MLQRIKERYTLLEMIGQAGMGPLYKALDTEINRYVVIKTTRDRPNETALKTFYQEMAIFACLSHPNLVEVIDTYESDEDGIKKPYLVMPFLQGHSLSQVIEQESEKLTVERCVRIVTQVGRGLHAAHQENLVHGDIKPSNIFLLENDQVKILDFGIARLADPKSSIEDKGTLLYRSPEQTKLKEPTARSDIFSLGVVLYEMLAKRHPFRSEAAEEIAQAICFKRPLLVNRYNPTVPYSIARIVRKALTKDPRNRFRTAKDFADSLEKAFEKSGTLNRLKDADQRRRERSSHITEIPPAADREQDLDRKPPKGTDARFNPGPEPEIDRHTLHRQAPSQEARAGLMEAIDEHLFDESFEKALELANSALQDFPDDPEFERLKKEAELGIERKKHVDNLIGQARVCIENQQYDQAIAMLEEASRMDPWNLQIQSLQMETMLSHARLLLSKDWKAAEGLLQKVLSIDKNNEQAKSLLLAVSDAKQQESISRLLARAKELQSEGQFDLAEQVLYDGLAQYPNEPSLSELLATIHRSHIVQQIEERARDLVSKDRYTEAERLMEETLREYKENSQLMNLLTYVRNARKQRENEEEIKGRIATATKALEEQKDLPSLRQALSNVEQSLSSYPDMPELLECAAQLKREIKRRWTQVQGYKEEASKKIRQRDLKTALELINNGLELDPEDDALLRLKEKATKRRRLRYRKAAVLASLAVLFVAAIVGYQRYRSGIYRPIDESEPSAAPTRSAPLDAAKDPLKEVPTKSQDLYELNKIYDEAIEAWKVRDEHKAAQNIGKIVAMDPDDQTGVKAKALELKQRMIGELKNEIAHLSPSERETDRELALWRKIQVIEPSDHETRSRIDLLSDVAMLKGQIKHAIESHRLLPPEPGNAWDLNKRLKQRSNDQDTTYEQNKKEIHSAVIRIAKQKCRSYNDECKNYIAKSLRYFPNDLYLENIEKQAALAAPDAKPALPNHAPIQPPYTANARGQLNEYLQKARDAYARGDYVVPEYENAVYYALEALKLDRNHSEAKKIKTNGCRAAERSVRELKRHTNATDQERKEENLETINETQLGIRDLCWKSGSTQTRKRKHPSHSSLP